MSKRALRLFYASLPHELRRQIFRLRWPSAYRAWQTMREGTDPKGQIFERFDRHRCIFVHVPKTAGVSISKSLFGTTVDGHRSIAQLQLIFRKSEFDRYFKFAFVRNPWDRLVSAFSYLKQGGYSEFDRQWAEQNLSGYPDFDSFVRRWVNPINIQKIALFKPQTDYITVRGALAMDFVGYVENLKSDFEFVQRRLDIDGPLLALNRTYSRRNHYKVHYTERTKQIVADVYRNDIETLGYVFDNSTIDSVLAARGFPAGPVTKR